MRILLRLLLVATGLLTSSGCIYAMAALQPIRATGEADVTMSSKGRIDPAKWTVEAKSSERSVTSGRNNLVFIATVSEIHHDKIVISGRFTSTSVENTDPNRFYVYLTAGDRMTPVTSIEVGEPENTPYNYSYQYTAQVESGKVVFSDGSSATLYTTETRTADAQEDYWSRAVTMTFEGEDIVPSSARELFLEVRDLGVTMTIRWHVTITAPPAAPAAPAKKKTK